MSIVAILAACTTFIQYFYTRERVTEERRNQLGMKHTDAARLEVHKEAGMWDQLRACIQSKYWIQIWPHQDNLDDFCSDYCGFCFGLLQCGKRNDDLCRNCPGCHR